MYSLRQLRKVLKNPKLAAIEVNRLIHRRGGRWNYNERGLDIWTEEWDILAILDACRYDLFKTVADLPGDTRRVESRGSSTIEFLRGNVDGRQLHDTVYVTANPQLYQHRRQIDAAFHAERHVWRDGWDDEAGTVLPETVTEAAIDGAREFPHKRLLVHYLQPHQPFLGGEAGLDMQAIAAEVDNRLEFWNQVGAQSTSIDDDTLWDAYANNLRAVLPAVRELINEVDGTAVIAADHGELLNERISPLPITLSGHPQGIYVPALVDVPWHVYDDGTERVVTADATEAKLTPPTASVADRLEDLGYLQ